MTNTKLKNKIKQMKRFVVEIEDERRIIKASNLKEARLKFNKSWNKGVSKEDEPWDIGDIYEAKW